MGAPLFHVATKLLLTATSFHTLVLNENYTEVNDIPKQRWNFEKVDDLYYICNDNFGSCIGVMGNELVNHAQVALYQKDLSDCSYRWKLDALNDTTTITLENTTFAIDLVRGDPKWRFCWLYPIDNPLNHQKNNRFIVVLDL